MSYTVTIGVVDASGRKVAELKRERVEVRDGEIVVFRGEKIPVTLTVGFVEEGVDRTPTRGQG